MSSKLKKIACVAVIGLVSMVVYHDYFADPPGYCALEKRRFTDDELKEIAVKFEFDRGNLKIDEPNPEIKNFIANHPECCRVIRAGKKTIYQKVFESKFETMDTDFSVELAYESNQINPRTKRPLPHRFIDEYVDLDGCGNVIKTLVSGRS
ncbi:MAG: hypothetical protein WA071_14720 [Undibacterium umbellatum]|uniref:hypothetical protein n=1 Tax=Undibacterium umbellatum TaxID=2762300 RepID=UPI003BB544CB